MKKFIIALGMVILLSSVSTYAGKEMGNTDKILITKIVKNFQNIHGDLEDRGLNCDNYMNFIERFEKKIKFKLKWNVEARTKIIKDNSKAQIINYVEGALSCDEEEDVIIDDIEKCPEELVNCIVGFEPKSYIGDDGCKKFKCVPQAKNCPEELVNCIVGFEPKSYIGDDGCKKLKCVPQAKICPEELVNCLSGFQPKSYIGDNGCTKFKCVPQAKVCPLYTSPSPDFCKDGKIKVTIDNNGCVRKPTCVR